MHKSRKLTTRSPPCPRLLKSVHHPIDDDSICLIDRLTSSITRRTTASCGSPANVTTSTATTTTTMTSPWKTSSKLNTVIFYIWPNQRDKILSILGSKCSYKSIPEYIVILGAFWTNKFFKYKGFGQLKEKLRYFWFQQQLSLFFTIKWQTLLPTRCQKSEEDEIGIWNQNKGTGLWSLFPNDGQLKNWISSDNRWLKHSR